MTVTTSYLQKIQLINKFLFLSFQLARQLEVFLLSVGLSFCNKISHQFNQMMYLLYLELYLELLLHTSIILKYHIR